MDISTPGNMTLDGGLISRLSYEVQEWFQVEHLQVPQDAPNGTVIFVGKLLMADSERAYDLIAKRWLPYQYTPTLRWHDGNQVALIANPGVLEIQPRNPVINLVLGLLTVMSITLTGALYECGGCMPSTWSEWVAGVPMMSAMMSILLAHEFGHYFAARFHKVEVTLPYFIPLPPPISPVGTLGAFIQLRAPFKTKKQLFDIGIAGPIGGLIFAIPLTIWGVLNSKVHSLDRVVGSFLEGNSIFYLGVKYWLHGLLLPSFDAYQGIPFWQEFAYLLAGVIPAGAGSDILIDSFTLAAWFGLFVTAMNLLPVGQLDGGHLVYCLLGDKARWLGITIVGLMVVIGLASWPGWFLWAGLVYFVIGVGHPPPLNELSELGTSRTILAYVMIIVFILLFMPTPLQLI